MPKLNVSIESLKRTIEHHSQALEAAQAELDRVHSLGVEVQVVELLNCLWNNGVLPHKKVEIIKAVRSATGLGLKESKAIVDYVL